MLNIGSKQIKTTRKALGFRIDQVVVARLIKDNVPIDIHRPPLTLDILSAVAQLSRLKTDVDREGKIERWIDGQYHPPQPSVTLDLLGTLERLDGQRYQREINASLILKRAQSGKVANNDFRKELGRYQTHYAAVKKARTHNLRVAAKKINGVVVWPGAIFDFNRVVGDRSEASGFRPAPVIAGGELADGLGGGACQIAGTLHAAVMFSGLEVVERQPHSRPSSYIRLGLDATVAYPRINYRFRNNLSYPIAIAMRVENGLVKAALFGRTHNGLVRWIRRVDDYSAYQERVVDDMTLAPGMRQLVQRGIAGFELTTFRYITRDDGTTVRERDTMHYPPTPQIWRVGPAGDASKTEVVDDHKEYTAHGYLSMTWNPVQEKFDNVQRNGVTGKRGWTAQVGMPQPD